MRDPYELLADPAELGLLDIRQRFGLTSPEEDAELEAVARERERRRSFAAAGEIVTQRAATTA